MSESAAAVQARMLRHAASLVAPGGRLVYATCSSEPEENEGVFEALLGGEPGFRQAGPESCRTRASRPSCSTGRAICTPARIYMAWKPFSPRRPTAAAAADGPRVVH